MADRRYKFRSAGEAREEAERMEQLRDDEVSSLREQGDEAGADRAADRWNQEINRVRGHARDLNEREARQTPQPEIPKPSPAPAARKPKRRSSPARRQPSRDDRQTGRASSKPSRLQRFTRSGYQRSGAQAQVASWGDLAWQLTGLVIGLALLTLFISSSSGVSAFGGILGGIANGLGLIVDPVDPLAKGAVANTVERTSSSAKTIPITATSTGRTMVAPAGVHV